MWIESPITTYLPPGPGGSAQAPTLDQLPLPHLQSASSCLNLGQEKLIYIHIHTSHYLQNTCTIIAVGRTQENNLLTLSVHEQEGYSTHFCHSDSQSVIHSTADLEDGSPSTLKSDINLKYWIIIVPLMCYFLSLL